MIKKNPHTNTSLKLQVSQSNQISKLVKQVFFKLSYIAQISHLPLGCTSCVVPESINIAVWDQPLLSDTHGGCSDHSLCLDSDREEATPADAT